MSAMVYAVGFEPWDVTMSDLLNVRVTLQDLRGIIFVGGFSYVDVLHFTKEWDTTIGFNIYIYIYKAIRYSTFISYHRISNDNDKKNRRIYDSRPTTQTVGVMTLSSHELL